MENIPFAGLNYSTSPASLSNSIGSPVDELALDPRFQELQTTLRTYLLDEARSAENTRQQTPIAQQEGLPDAQDHRLLLQRLSQSQDQISLTRKIEYLRVWICECAPWLDMFDQERHFGVHIPLLAQHSSAVLFALLALAARQVERKSGRKGSTQDSLELYAQAISSLAPSVDATDPEVLVTACILCVLEMMSVSPRDWRRHSEGCAAIFENLNVSGFSGGLLQAVFWCYARMDLCAAIIADGAESTTLPIQKWVTLDAMPTDDDDLSQQSLIKQAFHRRGAEVTDMYANYAVYLCARVCDLFAQRTRHLELGEDNGYTDEGFQQQWSALGTDLQDWYERRPAKMLPVEEIAREADGFPRILFAHWAAISGNQLYHTACILMNDLPRPKSATSSDPNSVLWHARRVVGISLTNPHRGCLNNAIQPLYVAGKAFTHRDEHKVVINLLYYIEACSGWGSQWRIKDLENFWGYRTSRNVRASNCD